MARIDRGALRAFGMWRRFIHVPPREQEGSIIVLTALVMLVMLGFAGLVIDVGHQMTEYRQARNAADAAALAGAYSLYTGSATETAIKQALFVGRHNGFGNAPPFSYTCSPPTIVSGGSSGAVTVTFLTNIDPDTPVSCPFDPTQVNYVRATVGATFPTFFIRVLGFLNQSVATTAVAEVTHHSLCDLCVLNTTNSNGGKDALKVAGGALVSGQSIRVVDDSRNHNAALTVTGPQNGVNGASLTISPPYAWIGVVGGVSGGGTISPAPVIGISPVPDPLISLPDPSTFNLYSGQAAYKADPNLTNSQSQTIDPGIYSNISDSSSGTLTLNPGIYVITGTFKVTGSGPVVGSGVMLYIGCPGKHLSDGLWVPCNSPLASNTPGQLNLSGQGPVTLNAPTATQLTGLGDPPVYAGMLLFQDRYDTKTASISGSSSTNPNPSCIPGQNTSPIAGSIYAKRALVAITGNGSAQTGVDSLVVADQLMLAGNTNGSGGLYMSDCSDQNVKVTLLNALVR